MRTSCTLCGGAYESGCCIPTEESTHEVNYMGNRPRQNFNVGQLAKQIVDNSSSKFGANTENNPKEECKAVMTRGKMATMTEEEKDEKIVDGDKQQLVTEPAFEPEDNFCKLEEIEDEKDYKENENTISKNENEINN
ncbi:hypothetical protein GmHk_10G029007 [Glycine max]|nr:hypothetical protein GmHk_10G029007 [Glycine max]